MPTINYHIGPTDSLTTALKAAQPNSIIHMAPGLYDLGAYHYMREPPPGVTIQAANAVHPPVIHCPATLQITGAQGLTFKDVIIDGRINLDNIKETRNNGNITFHRVLWRYTSTKASTKDMLKVAHIPGVAVIDSQFIRTVGVTDRPVDCVGPHGMLIDQCYFQDPLQGAIQIKGGARNAIIRRSIINCTKPGAGLAQRAIQLGGSSCYECFGWDPSTGDKLYSQDVGYEAIDCLAEDNLILNCITPLSISTSKGSVVRNNTSYWDPRFGAMFLWRFLQEDANKDQPGFPLMKGQQDLQFLDNLFLYRNAAVNAAIQNIGGVGAPQALDTFQVHGNAFYSTTPITNEAFGDRTYPIYVHRHAGAWSPPWAQLDYRGGWRDQLNPMIKDWGEPNMRPTAPGYLDEDGQVTVGCRQPAGPIGFTYSEGAEPLPPPEKGDYPVETPFYGWEGPGSAPAPAPEPIPEPIPIPTPIPVIEYHVLDPDGYLLAVLPDLASARAYRKAITIERVETIRTKVTGDGDDQ